MNGKEGFVNQTGSPKREAPMLRSLKSKSNVSQSSQSNKVIDIMRLLSRRERSRESIVNYQVATYNQQEQRPVRHSDCAVNQRVSNFSRSEDEEQYSTYANRAALRNANLMDESFLSSNDSSGIIGILIYLLFMGFITAEAIATVYIIPKHRSSGAFYFETALMTILLSELLYYLLIRYFSSRTKNKLFLHRSARASFDKLMQLSRLQPYRDQEKTFIDWLLGKPYALLGVVTGMVVFGQLLYSKFATQTIFLFEGNEEGYLVSTMFWSNFTLPYLFANFYLSRAYQDKNWKVMIFSFLILAYIIGSLYYGLLFFSLMVIKLAQTYIHSKKEFDTFHINQFIKFLLLCLTVIWIIIKYYCLTHESLFNEQVAHFVTTLLFHVLLLSAAMFLTRVIAIKYLKEQLYRHFYTETGINIAFITATFVLTLTYIGSSSDLIMGAVVINLVFLCILGVILYVQGRDKMTVVINPGPEEQENS